MQDGLLKLRSELLLLEHLNEGPVVMSWTFLHETIQ